MGKTTCIVRLTPADCEQIQDRMLEACRKIAADHGLVIESAGWRSLDSGIGFEPAFRVSIPAPDGTPFNLEKDMFRYMAEQYGLAASDLGREFTTGDERFRITGIDPKRPKYPISVERIPDRRGFKFTAENVAMLLNLIYLVAVLAACRPRDESASDSAAPDSVPADDTASEASALPSDTAPT